MKLCYDNSIKLYLEASFASHSLQSVGVRIFKNVLLPAEGLFKQVDCSNRDRLLSIQGTLCFFLFKQAHSLLELYFWLLILVVKLLDLLSPINYAPCNKLLMQHCKL